MEEPKEPKQSKVIKVITKDSLKELIDETNKLRGIEIIQFLERQSGEFTLIYKG